MTIDAKPVKEFFHRGSEDFYRLYDVDPNFQERLEVWTGFIDRFGRVNGSVLDVGCGPGVLSLYAAQGGMRVTGLDPAENMLRICRRAQSELGVGDATFIQSEFNDLPQLGFQADLVLCSSVLEYFEAPLASLRILAGAMAEGGALVVSLPNAASFYRMLDRFTFRLYGRPKYYRLVKTMMSTEAFAVLAAQAGLKVVETALYATHHRLGRLCSWLPPRRTAQLFASVLVKIPA